MVFACDYLAIGIYCFLFLRYLRVLVLARSVSSEQIHEILVDQHTLSKISKVRGPQISHLILFQHIVKKLPFRFTCRVSFIDIGVVSEHVHWEHSLSVEIDYFKSRIQEAHGGHTAAHSTNNNRLVRVSHTVVQGEFLIVGVANQVEPYDVLEALHEGSEAYAPLVLATVRLIVANHDC